MKKGLILLIDDDADIRYSMKEILEGEGFRVIEAENGQQALDIIDELKEELCLIMLDLMMPVMTGWQFLEHVDKNSLVSGVPIIVASAVGSSKTVTGPIKFLCKPFHLESLMASVSSHCCSGKDSDEEK